MRKPLLAGALAVFIGWCAVVWYQSLHYLEALLGHASHSERRMSFQREAAVSLPMFRRPKIKLTPPAPTDLPTQRAEAPLFGIGSPAALRESSPLVIANQFMAQHRAQWQVQNYHELRAQLVNSPDGVKVKYGVFQDGMPILGLDILLDMDENHEITNVTNNYAPVQKADLSDPVLSAEDVLKANAGRLGIEEPLPPAISQRVLYLAPGGDQPELAYIISLKESPDAKSATPFIFRASDGTLLGRQNASQ